MRKALLTGGGGVAAALLGSLCCVGPLLFVTLGVGAGIASTFEPLRPVFGVLMLAMFAVGFRAVYGRRSVEATTTAAITAATCAVPSRRRRDLIVLWGATILAVVLWTFPTWSLWLLR